MKSGTTLEIGKSYYSKDGMGNIMRFNVTGRSQGNQDIWYDGFCARNIKDIEETKESAEHVTYPNRNSPNYPAIS